MACTDDWLHWWLTVEGEFAVSTHKVKLFILQALGSRFCTTSAEPFHGKGFPARSSMWNVKHEKLLSWFWIEALRAVSSRREIGLLAVLNFIWLSRLVSFLRSSRREVSLTAFLSSSSKPWTWQSWQWCPRSLATRHVKSSYVSTFDHIQPRQQAHGIEHPNKMPKLPIKIQLSPDVSITYIQKRETRNQTPEQSITEYCKHHIALSSIPMYSNSLDSSQIHAR